MIENLRKKGPEWESVLLLRELYTAKKATETWEDYTTEQAAMRIGLQQAVRLPLSSSWSICEGKRGHKNKVGTE